MVKVLRTRSERCRFRVWRVSFCSRDTSQRRATRGSVLAATGVSSFELQTAEEIAAEPGLAAALMPIMWGMPVEATTGNCRALTFLAFI